MGCGVSAERERSLQRELAAKAHELEELAAKDRELAAKDREALLNNAARDRELALTRETMTKELAAREAEKVSAVAELKLAAANQKVAWALYQAKQAQARAKSNSPMHPVGLYAPPSIIQSTSTPGFTLSHSSTMGSNAMVDTTRLHHQHVEGELWTKDNQIGQTHATQQQQHRSQEYVLALALVIILCLRHAPTLHGMPCHHWHLLRYWWHNSHLMAQPNAGRKHRLIEPQPHRQPHRLELCRLPSLPNL